jgi:hypothetical protein
MNFLHGGISLNEGVDYNATIDKIISGGGARNFTCRFGFVWVPTGITANPLFNGSTPITLPYKKLILKKFKSSLDWVGGAFNVGVSHRVLITSVGPIPDLVTPVYGAPTPPGVTVNGNAVAFNAWFQRDSSQGSLQEDTENYLFSQGGFTHSVVVYGNPSPAFQIGDSVTFVCELQFEVIQ